MMMTTFIYNSLLERNNQQTRKICWNLSILPFAKPALTVKESVLLTSITHLLSSQLLRPVATLWWKRISGKYLNLDWSHEMSKGRIFLWSLNACRLLRWLFRAEGLVVYVHVYASWGLYDILLHGMYLVHACVRVRVCVCIHSCMQDSSWSNTGRNTQRYQGLDILCLTHTVLDFADNVVDDHQVHQEGYGLLVKDVLLDAWLGFRGGGGGGDSHESFFIFVQARVWTLLLVWPGLYG